jgi:hypothetical protein
MFGGQGIAHVDQFVVPTPLLGQVRVLFPQCGPQPQGPVRNRAAPGLQAPLAQIPQEPAPRLLGLPLLRLRRRGLPYPLRYPPGAFTVVRRTDLGRSHNAVPSSSNNP